MFACFALFCLKLSRVLSFHFILASQSQQGRREAGGVNFTVQEKKKRDKLRFDQSNTEIDGRDEGGEGAVGKRRENLVLLILCALT